MTIDKLHLKEQSEFPRKNLFVLRKGKFVKRFRTFLKIV